MKKIIINIIAAIPIIASFISTFLEFVLIADYPIMLILAIGNFLAGILLIDTYKDFVKLLTDVYNILTNHETED